VKKRGLKKKFFNVQKIRGGTKVENVLREDLKRPKAGGRFLKIPKDVKKCWMLDWGGNRWKNKKRPRGFPRVGRACQD